MGLLLAVVAPTPRLGDAGPQVGLPLLRACSQRVALILVPSNTPACLRARVLGV